MDYLGWKLLVIFSIILLIISIVQKNLIYSVTAFLLSIFAGSIYKKREG